MKSDLDLKTKYDWYERAVQNPESEVDFMRTWFKKLHGRFPLVLREDFCGTGAISCQWVRKSAEATAIGVDLDPEPIAMGKERHWSKLSPTAKKRMTYLEGNVLEKHKFTADVICAFNFSYFIFKTRPQLLSYFKKVRQGLGKQGVFFLDLFGGPESQKIVTDKRKIGGLTYYWECQSFNPITAECTFAIHFRDAKGKKHENVFTYDWRLWTIAELREILTEAGFSRSIAFWEGDDEKGGGDGNYTPSEIGENCDAWVSYIAGLV
ncbi:MAG: class I SAM-dependent methyltransferase [Bacteriovoracaceae bacterium]|nr:class I SAM-dependent methyltransferase [Bacteriovoracaceae bacterium]